MELERDILSETRDITLKHATERYWRQLNDCGIQERPELSVKRRTGEKALENLA